MICSNIHDISYAIAFGIIFQLVFQNQSLADQPCTTEGLYPLEVLYEVLSVDKHPYKNRPIPIMIRLETFFILYGGFHHPDFHLY